DYAAATAQATFAISQAGLAITWASPAAIVYGTVLGAAQLDATANLPGTFTYSPAAGTMLSVGVHTLSVTFTPADTTDYTTATASPTTTVPRAPRAVPWTPPGAIVYGRAVGAAQLDATANVPGSFAYNPAAGTVLGAGVYTLSATFTPTDSTDYTTAIATVTI